MALTSVLYIAFTFQAVSMAAGQHNASLQEFDWKASGVVQEARVQLVILTNQLLTNATILTQIAEGNASLLLANLYNDINKGIADAQVKASQIGTTFQTNLSKQVEEAMRQAGVIYTRVESSLRKSNNNIEETVKRLINNMEQQLAKVVATARSELTGGSTTTQGP
ncbi:uncharacterized protein LOC128995614 [Macrosteles quadrilineatus]|uniref:uncharacterized protein LOC128995614 n=1 Tax=Macrosteles quadrilineatus TaxID=74068 RepID=UPI0023E30332|nr:uncharacterized protein LOC128995614 [Macrosteles quadrilineatus]